MGKEKKPKRKPKKRAKYIDNLREMEIQLENKNYLVQGSNKFISMKPVMEKFGHYVKGNAMDKLKRLGKQKVIFLVKEGDEEKKKIRWEFHPTEDIKAIVVDRKHLMYEKELKHFVVMMVLDVTKKACHKLKRELGPDFSGTVTNAHIDRIFKKKEKETPIEITLGNQTIELRCKD